MATGRYVKVDIAGAANGGSPWFGEIFQTGITLVGGDMGGLIGRDAIKEPTPTFDATVDAGYETNDQFEMDLAWHGSQDGTPFSKGSLLQIAELAVVYCNAMRSTISTAYHFTGIKITAFDQANKVINGGNFYTLKTPIAGTGVMMMPPQSAMVLTLRTGARGPGGRGRMYWPHLTAVQTNGVLGTTQPTAARTGYKAFSDAVWALGAVTAVVNKSLQTYSGVTAVETGNHVDTQRRRATGIPESYTGLTI
jgi:hypothetical protein